MIFSKPIKSSNDCMKVDIVLGVSVDDKIFERSNIQLSNEDSITGSGDFCTKGSVVENFE